MLARARIPNLLTGMRAMAVPLCLGLILIEPANAPQWLLGIFVAASITDFLDGYLARKWNAVSPLGAMLDPVADKLLVALMLIYLLTVLGGAVLLPVILIVLRELYISSLREFLANRQVLLPVSKSGKWKTALQMVAIALLLFSNICNDIWHDAVFGVGMAALYAAAMLALTSAMGYTRVSWVLLR